MINFIRMLRIHMYGFVKIAQNCQIRKRNKKKHFSTHFSHLRK